MAELKAAPALSTPAENLFDQAEPLPDDSNTQRRTDDELCDVYEVARTAREIREAGKNCVALQFPDSMLGDAPRVVNLLKTELAKQRAVAATAADAETGAALSEENVYILADTSYSACCVDEIAAEHADADVVVHYGRSCLSPTSRLPVVYVFTKHALDEDHVVDAFVKEFPDRETANIILMADVTYQDHVPAIFSKLKSLGYKNVLSTAVVRHPLGSIPNRNLIGLEGGNVADDKVDLHNYSIFHISEPPTSLLLALAVRVKSFFIYPTSESSPGPSTELLAPRTVGMLGRRYAKVLTMATAGIIGILVNTLSVSSYLSAVANIRKRIADAGKKSYLVVVGKLNPVKLANFAEIDGWVVVGCWESSLVEEDAGFYQPVVTPFELEMALMSDDERIWGVKWWGGLEALANATPETAAAPGTIAADIAEVHDTVEQEIDEEDSEVPQFDLRTGRLITTSRPMRSKAPKPTNGVDENRNGSANGNASSPAGALSLRPKAELATINGVVSPGAEYLRSQRTWRGLGTEFNDGDVEANTQVEEGRSGIARGYTVGEDAQRT